METVEMNKEQVLQDLQTLRRKFQHVHKYYPLSDKELTLENFNIIIKDLTQFLNKEL